jgi:hypothetical protein
LEAEDKDKTIEKYLKIELSFLLFPKHGVHLHSCNLKFASFYNHFMEFTPLKWLYVLLFNPSRMKCFNRLFN